MSRDFRSSGRSAEELPQARQQGLRLVQDTVILSFEEQEPGSGDGRGDLPARARISHRSFVESIKWAD